MQNWLGFSPRKRVKTRKSHLSSLFVLAMHIISRDLDKAARRNQFSHHPECSDPLVTHLSFADDFLIFFDGSERSVVGIIEVLRSFSYASGLQLNLEKSELFLDGNNTQLSATLATRFGIVNGSLPVSYLGLPLLPHKMRPKDDQPLLDTVYKRINFWTVRHLSFVGRLQLIQSVLYKLISFWIFVFPLPKSV